MVLSGQQQTIANNSLVLRRQVARNVFDATLYDIAIEVPNIAVASQRMAIRANQILQVDVAHHAFNMASDHLVLINVNFDLTRKITAIS